MANILIIDDDEILCDVMCRHLAQMSHRVQCALTLKDGLKKATSEHFDVVLLDVRLPDGSGLKALPSLQKLPSFPEVIIMTADGDPDGGELAIRSGAWDYIEKPASMKEITLPVIRALQYRNEKRRSVRALKRDQIIGKSKSMQQCLDLLAEASGSEENVLITGETGTGKELFAAAIHENSLRCNKDFVVVDCAVLPPTLVESTLFGHEKGAFTGADKSSTGLVRHADGGTLFLDEVGEIPLPIQKSLLRVLQERRFRPLGGQKEVRSDFRLVAATNRNLDQMAKEGRFREDLLFRLKSFVIELPPLRDRKADIGELTMHFIHRISRKYKTGIKGFSPEFLEALTAYEWPGNVRELLSALERVFVSSREDPVLFPRHLPTHIRVQLARASVSKKGTEAKTSQYSLSRSEPPGDLRTALMSTEKQYLRDLMVLTEENIKEACRISGISRARLYDRLRKHGIRSRS